jgi:thioredoxin reductase
MAIVPAGSAARSAGVRLTMAGVATVILAADQVTKALVLASHPAGAPSWTGSAWAARAGRSTWPTWPSSSACRER